jgi:hypothetical protein
MVRLVGCQLVHQQGSTQRPSQAGLLCVSRGAGITFRLLESLSIALARSMSTA